ncbi:MAG: peptidoglycan DD-metalloendopeptidase family protein [Clostridiales bacterium]|nr:peptidoglycan DD-metalloendopeptidase family protein [Clostridiales bacterium]
MLCLAAVIVISSVFFTPSLAAETTTSKGAAESTTTEETTDNELEELQNKYDTLEQRITQSKQNINILENGKVQQKQNISALETQINGINEQITVLQQRLNLLNGDITKLNGSINSLKEELQKLNTQIDDTEEVIYETERSIELISDKVFSRHLMSYMAGEGSNLEFLLGSKNLRELYTKLQMINNLSEYDSYMTDKLNSSLEKLDALNTTLTNDRADVADKLAELTGEQNTLYKRQDDVSTSAYVLKMKKEMSQYKYSEAVAYFKTLDESSADYNAMLKLFSDEQDKIDAEMNAYLLKYGSSANDVKEATTAPSSTTVRTVKEDESGADEDEDASGKTETTVNKPYQFTTVPYRPQTLGSQFTTTTTTTTTTTAASQNIDDLYSTLPPLPTLTVKVVTAESTNLIWPMPYNNCYISAYYGQYPHGGEHHGIDICVHGGTYGKKVVAAQSGRVIRMGYNHWSMGNYVILDHGCGVFTAYYHMSVLYVDQNDTVAQGQTIGLAGATGNTTGPHLHFEVRVNRNGTIVRMNPLNWVKMPS